jgi:hypothetical protein
VEQVLEVCITDIKVESQIIEDFNLFPTVRRIKLIIEWFIAMASKAASKPYERIEAIG